MAQEPSSRELLEAVKQQESGGRRYKADGKTLLEGPQTKYGTAKGEMQVLDMTNKDPGFGVKPARDDSPDERARVGRDYLDAMVKRYGSRETALVAYNWGPGNTDKWLEKGGDFNKLPAETRNYVAKITGSLGKTKMAQASGSTKVAQATPKAASVKAGVQSPMFAQLGPSYQAAFAVSLLADEAEKEGKDEDAPSESEKMLAAMPSKPAVVDLDLGYQSPFPEVQAQAAPVTRKQVSFTRPVRMAAGGLPFAPTASVRPSARAELDAIKAEYDTFAPALEEYNKAVEKYNADVYKPYQAQVDAYNVDLEKYKAEQLAPYQTQLDAYNAALNKYTTENSTPYQAQIDAYNAALNKYKTDVYAPYETQVDTYNTALNKYNADVYAPYEAAQKKYDAEYAAVFATPKPVSYAMSKEFQNLLARRPVAPAEFSMTAPTAPAEFSMAAPTAPAGFSMAAPTAPAQFSRAAPTKPAEFAQKAPAGPAASQEAYNAKMAAAKADAGRRQIALSVAMDPQAYGLSMNKLFAEGGSVDAPQIMEDKATSVEGLDIPISRSAKELQAYTQAMNPAVKTRSDDLGADTRGYIIASSPDTLNLNYKLTPAEREITTLHELEHSMDARGGDIYGRPNFAKLGGMDNNYRAYSLMGDDWSPITATVKNMVDNREKLEKFFGRPLDNAYFRKDSYDELKKAGKTKAMFSEQLASLSALEQTTGKFLTQDPEMRELFPNTRMMAVYDALTGPRQTRMDARDLPPHTPVPSYTYQQNPALRFIQKNLTGENEYGTSYRPFPIKRAKGSPETGEVGYFQDPFGVPDSGPVTSDTLSKGKDFKAAEALQALKEVGAGAVSNAESLVRGAVAQVPGLVGDLESLGRKGINFSFGPGGVKVNEKTLAPTSEEIRAKVPRITPARPESSGMESLGEVMAPSFGKGGKKAADLLRDLKKPKEVPQTAPAPAPMAGPTPEVLTELARMDEQRQLPRNAGQAPDPFMGVRPTVEEAQANVAARQAEPLPPPPAEVVVPPEMLEMPPVASPMQAGMPVERPFVGRLDAFIDTIKNPVQLGQLKGQLKGKFRDYDLERVERAFPGMDDKTKLTPDQIKQALAGVHSPQKWISETVQPKAGVHYQNTDNVWGAPLGTTNLYLEQAPEALAANDLLKKAAQVFNPFLQKTTSSVPTPEALVQARALLSEPEILKIVDPELISNLSKSFDKVEKNVGLVKEYSGVIKNVSYGFSNPILYVDKAVASAKYQHQPFFKFKEEALDAEREVLKQKFMAQGSNEQDASFLAFDEINANFELHNKNAEKIASFRVQELAIAEGQKHGIFVDLPDVSLVKWDELNKVTRPMEGNTAFKESVENALEPARVTIHEATKNIKRVMDPEIKKVGDILYQRGNLYEGNHPKVASKPYPIGFARFSEHETTLSDKGTLQGRHFHELQSDLSKDMRKSGTTSGNAAKDSAEYNKLQNEVQQSKQKAMDKLQVLQQEKQNKIRAGELSNTRLKEIETEEEAIRKSLDTGIRAMEKRISILGGRVRDKASYSLQEPFAGFETNQMVRQQLLMKNAIQSAMRDGKGFATFPGAESNNPNLYVGKVELNLKQVIKDLGGKESGVELRLIELPPDKDGRPINATGVVWSPEAAARIAEKGIPFAKGGMVERQSADTRRYI